MTKLPSFCAERPLLTHCKLDTEGKLLVLEALLPYKSDMIEPIQFAVTDLVCSDIIFETSELVLVIVERAITEHLSETTNESIHLWASKLRLIIGLENSFEELAGMAA